MFAYSDPTGTGALAAAGALQNYREKVGFFDQRFHSVDAIRLHAARGVQ